MGARAFAACAVALVAACGAKLGDPSITGGSDGVDAAGGSAVDAGTGLPIDAAAIDAAVAPPDARACTGSAAEGHCFLYHATSVDWADASAACVADGTHLAVITDQTENAAVLSLIGATDPAFIGGTDQVTEGTFLWVDGTPFMFTNFNAGEPNNGGNPSTHEEDCLVMRVDGSTAGKWDDRPCAPEGVSTPGVYPYVCEF